MAGGSSTNGASSGRTLAGRVELVRDKKEGGLEEEEEAVGVVVFAAAAAAAVGAGVDGSLGFDCSAMGDEGVIGFDSAVDVGVAGVASTRCCAALEAALEEVEEEAAPGPVAGSSTELVSMRGTAGGVESSSELTSFSFPLPFSAAVGLDSSSPPTATATAAAAAPATVEGPSLLPPTSSCSPAVTAATGGGSGGGGGGGK